MLAAGKMNKHFPFVEISGISFSILCGKIGLEIGEAPYGWKEKESSGWLGPQLQVKPSAATFSRSGKSDSVFRSSQKPENPSLPQVADDSRTRLSPRQDRMGEPTSAQVTLALPQSRKTLTSEQMTPEADGEVEGRGPRILWKSCLNKGHSLASTRTAQPHPQPGV